MESRLSRNSSDTGHNLAKIFSEQKSHLEQKTTKRDGLNKYNKVIQKGLTLFFASFVKVVQNPFSIHDFPNSEFSGIHTKRRITAGRTNVPEHLHEK